jgi:hypothetical protein
VNLKPMEAYMEETPEKIAYRKQVRQSEERWARKRAAEPLIERLRVAFFNLQSDLLVGKRNRQSPYTAHAYRTLYRYAFIMWRTVVENSLTWGHKSPLSSYLYLILYHQNDKLMGPGPRLYREWKKTQCI